MPPWTCPDCQRQFARTKQGHECAPAMELEEYFATGPERERPIYEAVKAHLDTVGPVHVEPVSVGIFFKAPKRVAQLRPMTRWVALSFSLPRHVQDPRISRKPIAHGALWYYVVNLAGADDVDDTVKAWLTEAYLAAS